MTVYLYIINHTSPIVMDWGFLENWKSTGSFHILTA